MVAQRAVQMAEKWAVGRVVPMALAKAAKRAAQTVDLTVHY